MSDLTYFTHDELQCPLTGKVKLAPGFGEQLDMLRAAYDRPMIVNSACRSQQHNIDIGGHPRSLHVYDKPYWLTGGCCAIDIAMTSGTERAALISLALTRGWSVGVAKTFLHLDRRDIVGLPQVVYTY